MYYVVVAVLMFALPVLSVIWEMGHGGAALTPLLIAKWYVFWAVGWRLFLAGVRQVAQPAYTAQEILGLKSDESLVVVRELGFANLAMGTLGILSIAVPPWQLAAALAGGIFYALAGVAHVLQPHRNRLETVAMLSDLFAAVVLLGTCILAFFGR
ncbi:DUF6790 family protein [Variovorax sp. YR216]|uniref:DUF6790 family protein n=1 Tax=Variovorax sp. YR216 TaxID=1882828 RepID=UPI00089D601B|nr:DUF6790 family protein [Variovorax sp. YR216]SEB25407.1 hypothetical protein SAMN05444680_12520 [Variovorax sp. YR216]